MTHLIQFFKATPQKGWNKNQPLDVSNEINILKSKINQMENRLHKLEEKSMKNIYKEITTHLDKELTPEQHYKYLKKRGTSDDTILNEKIKAFCSQLEYPSFLLSKNKISFKEATSSKELSALKEYCEERIQQK